MKSQIGLSRLAMLAIAMSDVVIANPLKFLLVNQRSGYSTRRQNESDLSLNPVRWTACPDLPLPTTVECGNLRAPLDHHNPHSNGSIDISVMRLKSASPRRIGSLFVNLGGPGIPGTFLFMAMAQLQGTNTTVFSKDVLDSYDIIAVDPRGVGLSNPLQCDADMWNARPKIFDSLDQDGFAKLMAYNKAFGESCMSRTPNNLVPFLDSVSTVKDFDLIRQALGEEKFHYLGISYGTLLGQMYAEQFPERVGRMVLDSVLDHHTVGVTMNIVEATAFQTTLNAFMSWCGVDSACALKGENIPDILQILRSRSPIPSTNCPAESPCLPSSSYEDILTAIHGFLNFEIPNPVYGPTNTGWDELSQAINHTVATNDASLLSAPLVGPVDSIFYGTFAHLAIICADWGFPNPSAATLRAILTASSTLAPLTSGVTEFLNTAYCAGWPLPVRNPPHRLDEKKMAKVPPVLIVNPTLDPSTGLAWAVAVKEQMPGSRLVTRKGVGHTSYFLGGETTRAIDRWLVEGVLPEDGAEFES